MSAPVPPRPADPGSDRTRSAADRASRRLVGAALLLLLASGAALAEPLPVGVSVAPLAYVARQVGGPEIEVLTLIPPGAEPETYAPRPRQLEALSRTALYLAVGHPGLAVESRSVLPRLGPATRLLTLADAAPPSARTGDDPHLWLSPILVRTFAERVEAALADLDPEHAARYRDNGARFRAATDALIAELRARLDPLPPPRRFVVEHPAWGWLARDFGLEQVAIEHEGKPIGPRGLIPLIESLRAAGIRKIFVQPGTPHRSAAVVADEIGAELVVVDPLAEDWAANLRRFAAQLGD